MPDVTVPWSMAAGDRLIIEVDPGPTLPTPGLLIIPRAPNTPSEALLRVRCIGPRDFWWVSPDDGAPLLRNGKLRVVHRGAGFDWDVFDVRWGPSRLWVAFRMPDQLLVTWGAELHSLPDQPYI